MIIIPFLILYIIITITFVISSVLIYNTCEKQGIKFNPFEADNLLVFICFITGLLTQIFTISGVLFFLLTLILFGS